MRVELDSPRHEASDASRVPAPREVTALSVGLGLVLAVVFCGANAYLGLKVGGTVSASIPAAVVSMGLLKLLRRATGRRGSLLENNMVQTISSAGETLAGGIIFTIPALLMTHAWTGFDYWTVTLIGASGGLLGILFMIPLRRVLIADAATELTYPEGVACAQVLKTGEGHGPGAAHVLVALIAGALVKVLQGGVRLILGTVEMVVPVGKIGIYLGCDLSPALVAVGYIVGANVAVLTSIGGVLGWLVAIPILMATGEPASGDLLGRVWEVWSTQVRYIGVGGMVVGGVWSILSMRRGIAAGLRGLGSQLRPSSAGPAAVPRTERDMSGRAILGLFLVTVVVVTVVYGRMTGSGGVGLLATGLMVIAAFFLVAVSSYIAGLVGSSNTPWSGMTICALIFAALVLHLCGLQGPRAIVATLGVASVVCVAVASASDVSQDLKTGHLVGATPRAQQWGEVLGAVVPAFFLAPILGLLHAAYGIGTGGPESLQAPQAALFASLVEAFFGESARLPMDMVAVGAGLAAIVIVADEALRRAGAGMRLHVMPLVLGLYLPLTLIPPTLLGGLASLAVERSLRGRPDQQAEAHHRGVLISSGLIAGEAFAGIAIAVPVAVGVVLPIPVLSSAGLSLLAFVALFGLFVRAIVRRDPATPPR